MKYYRSSDPSSPQNLSELVCHDNTFAYRMCMLARIKKCTHPRNIDIIPTSMYRSFPRGAGGPLLIATPYVDIVILDDEWFSVIKTMTH